MISEVASEKGPLTVLWDPGANVSLLTHNAANRLGLNGIEGGKSSRNYIHQGVYFTFHRYGRKYLENTYVWYE